MMVVCEGNVSAIEQKARLNLMDFLARASMVGVKACL